MKKRKRVCGISLGIILLIWCFWGRYKDSRYIPTYEKQELSVILQKEKLTSEDYELFFLQTGLSPSVIQLLIKEHKEESILEFQELFFQKQVLTRDNVFWTIVQEDLEINKKVPTETFIAVKPGDIILSSAVHTLGYYHGHIGVVMNDGKVLAAIAMGENSRLIDLEQWTQYTNYVILRVKNMNEDKMKWIVEYAHDYLLDIPYRLDVGLIGNKTIDYIEGEFQAHCSYLVWYLYAQIGIDLDSDGGKIITPLDIFMSEEVEILQVYGMNPQLLKGRVCDMVYD